MSRMSVVDTASTRYLWHRTRTQHLPGCDSLVDCGPSRRPAAPGLAGAQGYQVLHEFEGGYHGPSSCELLEGTDGRLYGSTCFNSRFVVFAVEGDGTGFTQLHAIEGSPGCRVYASGALIEGSTDGFTALPFMAGNTTAAPCSPSQPTAPGSLSSMISRALPRTEATLTPPSSRHRRPPVWHNI